MANPSKVEKLKRKPFTKETKIEQNSLERDYQRLQEKVDFYVKMIGNKDKELLNLQERILKAATPEDKRKIMREAEKFIGLGEQNDEFEARIETEKNDPLLFEKAEAGVALLQYLKDNPQDGKIENFDNLVPEKFVKDSKLLEKIQKDPWLWAEIKTKARRGIDMREVMHSKDFNLKDPQSREALLKAGKRDAEKLLEVAKKNPHIIVGIALLAGAFWLLRKYKKTKTAIGLGLAGLLCLSSFGKGALGDTVRYFKEIWGFSEKQVEKGAQMVEDLKGKAGNALADTLSGKPEPKENMSEYDAHTEKYFNIIKERSTESAITYKGLREYAKQPIKIHANRKEALTDAKKLEDGLSLEGKEKTYWWNFLFEKAIVQIGEAGLHIATLGGYFVFKIAKEEFRFFRNLTKHIFHQEAGSFAELTQHYALNALFIGGVATAWEYTKLVGSEDKMLIAVKRGITKGITWPVYAIQMGGEGVHRFSKNILASKAGKPRLIAKWKKARNFIELVSIKGEKIARSPIKGTGIELWKSGKWVTSKIPKIGATKKMGRVLSKKTFKKAGGKIAESLKKSVKRASKLIDKIPAKNLRHLKVLKPVARVGGAPAAIALELALPDKLNANDEKLLMQKSSFLNQELAKRKFPMEYAWSIKRKDLRNKLKKLSNFEKKGVVDAIRAANERIKKELPKTPLFEIPPELKK